jgi:hypothetical protein
VVSVSRRKQNVKAGLRPADQVFAVIVVVGGLATALVVTGHGGELPQVIGAITSILAIIVGRSYGVASGRRHGRNGTRY